MSDTIIQQARDIAADQYIRLEMKRPTRHQTATDWADHVQAYGNLMRRGAYDDDLSVQATLVALRSASTTPFPNPLGWEVSYKDDGISDPWTASHLDQCVTVFCADIAELGREIMDYEHKWRLSRQLAKLGMR